MSKHTKEPWHQGTDERQIEGINGNIVCIVSGALLNESTIEDARRIVACVNACAGMKDPEADIAALRAEVATPVLVATNRLADALADARAQRDELLAALKMVADDDTGALEAYEAVRSAIANAEKHDHGAADES